ncbi:hypothetical protein ACSBR1_019445 [Camellia fascicularis]
MATYRDSQVRCLKFSLSLSHRKKLKKNPNCRSSILKKIEVVGRKRRSYTRRSKRPSSWTSQPPLIPTLPTIFTSYVCVSDVIKSMKRKWTLKQFPKILFFELVNLEFDTLIQKGHGSQESQYLTSQSTKQKGF